MRIIYSVLILCCVYAAHPCKCPAVSRDGGVGRSVYYERGFSYAVKAVFIDKNGITGGPAVITVYITQVLKRNWVKISKGSNLTLWVEKGCVCTELKKGETYLFLGYEDRDNKRLLYDEDCIAVPWKKRWPKYIKKWEERMTRQHMMTEKQRNRDRDKLLTSGVGRSGDIIINSDGSIISRLPASQSRQQGHHRRRAQERRVIRRQSGGGGGGNSNQRFLWSEA